MSSRHREKLICAFVFVNDAGTGVTCNILCPGFVATNLGRDMRGPHTPFFRRLLMIITWPIVQLLAKTPKHGAQTSVYCAVAPELENISGKYYK